MQKSVALLEAVPHHPEADSFDFQRSWLGLKHACSGHKLLILATCVVTVALTMAYIKIWPPVFIATVQVVGESDKDHERSNFYSTWAVFRNDQLSDESQMLISGPVLQEVIENLHLTDDEVYHTFFSYLGYRWTTSWVGRHYRMLKDWVFPPMHGPFDPTQEEVEAARTLIDFRSGVGVERMMETDIGTLMVRGPSPRVAQIANEMIRVYFKQRRERHVAEADSAYEALDVELKKAQAEINRKEDEIRQYYADNQLLLVFEKDKLDIGQAQMLKAQISDMQAGIAGSETTLRILEDQLAHESKDVVATTVAAANPLSDGLRQQLLTLQIGRKQTLLNYRPDSPEVKELDRQIGIISERLNQTPDNTTRQTTTVLSSQYEELRGRVAKIKADLAGARATMAAKQATYDQVENMLQTIPEKMRTVHDMERDHGTLEKKLSVIQEKMMIAAVSRATAQTAYSSIRVIEPASAPSEANWPRSKLLLLGAVALGLVAGVLLALLVDLFFGRVHRFRLASGQEVPLYAIVRRDRAFALSLFALAGPADPDQRTLSWSRE